MLAAIQDRTTSSTAPVATITEDGFKLARDLRANAELSTAELVFAVAERHDEDAHLIIAEAMFWNNRSSSPKRVRVAELLTAAWLELTEGEIGDEVLAELLIVRH